eukprot:jgi/Chlat1/4864/Chrsp31S04892
MVLPGQLASITACSGCTRLLLHKHQLAAPALPLRRSVVAVASGQHNAHKRPKSRSKRTSRAKPGSRARRRSCSDPRQPKLPPSPAIQVDREGGASCSGRPELTRLLVEKLVLGGEGQLVHQAEARAEPIDPEIMTDEVPKVRQPSFLSQLTMPDLTQGQTAGVLAFLAALYGTNSAACKVIEETCKMPATLACTLRFGLATITLLPWLFGEAIEQDLLLAGAELGFWLFAAVAAQVAASAHATVAGSASMKLLLTIGLVLAFEAGNVFSRKRISKRTWLAAGVSLSGMLVLMSMGTDLTVGLFPLNDLWSVLAVLLFGFHTWRCEAICSKVDATSIARLAGIQIGVVTLLFGLWEVQALSSVGNLMDIASLLNTQLTGLPWVSLLYAAFISTGLCLWLELNALRGAKASTVTLMYSTIPLWGAFFDFALRGELEPAVSSLAAAAAATGAISYWLLKPKTLTQRLPRAASPTQESFLDQLTTAFVTSQLKLTQYTRLVQQAITGHGAATALHFKGVTASALAAAASMNSVVTEVARDITGAVADFEMRVASGMLTAAVSAQTMQRFGDNVAARTASPGQFLYYASSGSSAVAENAMSSMLKATAAVGMPDMAATVAAALILADAGELPDVDGATNTGIVLASAAIDSVASSLQQAAGASIGHTLVSNTVGTVLASMPDSAHAFVTTAADVVSSGAWDTATLVQAADVVNATVNSISDVFG